MIYKYYTKTEFVCAAENEFYSSFDDVELHGQTDIFIEFYLPRLEK
jgi:hypothetical protein